MALRIEIECYCEYKCMCKPIPETKVTKQEIAYNLMRCNPALARYFSNRVQYTETVVDRRQVRKESPKPYRSIVEEKNLNILLSDRYQTPIDPQAPKREDVVSIKIDNFVNTYAQTSPKNHPQNKKSRQKAKKDPTEEQIREYYRELKQTSRYLPNTAFKKYFNRPIFQNYGRQNTKGTNDGIIYGNYLKTHNINPHSGENRPLDEETFYHALISASPDKFVAPQNVKIIEKQRGKNLSLTRFKQDQSLQKPMKKHENNPDVMLMDNIHQHNKLNKLSQTKVSPRSHHSPNSFKITPNKVVTKHSPVKQSKSPRSHQATQQGGISSQYVNKVQHIQPVKPSISSSENRKNLNSPKERQINFEKQAQQIRRSAQISSNQNQAIKNSIKISESPVKREQNKCPVDKIKENHMDHILSKKCNVQKSPLTTNKAKQVSTNKKTIQKLDFGPGSPKVCTCGLGTSSQKCECMVNVKQQLKERAQKDIDLNNRLIASARKETLYKNYSLNNVQNSKLDPHNYTHCCGTIYQPKS